MAHTETFRQLEFGGGQMVELKCDGYEVQCKCGQQLDRREINFGILNCSKCKREYGVLLRR